jgi:hypothetical protein
VRLILRDHDANCRNLVALALGHDEIPMSGPSAAIMRLVYHRWEVTLVTT